MTTFYKIKDYLNSIKQKYPTITFVEVEDNKYNVYGLTEENLIELGFEFDDYDITGTIATYKNNNLFACYLTDNQLYITESSISY